MHMAFSWPWLMSCTKRKRKITAVAEVEISRMADDSVDDDLEDDEEEVAGELQVEEIYDENFDMIAELSDEYQRLSIK